MHCGTTSPASLLGSSLGRVKERALLAREGGERTSGYKKQCGCFSQLGRFPLRQHQRHLLPLLIAPPLDSLIELGLSLASTAAPRSLPFPPLPLSPSLLCLPSCLLFLRSSHYCLLQVRSRHQSGKAITPRARINESTPTALSDFCDCFAQS